MKIGDEIYSTKVRPYENATIIKMDVTKKKKDEKEQIRTSYMAEYSDKTIIKFYGFDINRSIFKAADKEFHQMTLNDLFDI